MLYRFSWAIIGSVSLSSASSEWSSHSGQMDVTLDSLTHHNQALQDQISGIVNNGDYKSIAVIKEDLKQRNQRIQQLNNQLRHVDQSLYARKQEKKDTLIQSLNDELKTTEMKLQNAQKQRDDIKRELNDLNAQLLDDDENHDSLIQQLAELEKSNEQLQMEYSEEKSNYDNRIDFSDELYRYQKSIAQELSNLMTLNIDLQTEIPELEQELVRVKYEESAELERQILEHAKNNNPDGSEPNEIIEQANKQMAQSKIDQEWCPSLSMHENRVNSPEFKAAEEFTEKVMENVPNGTHQVCFKIFEKMLRGYGVSNPLFFDSKDESMEHMKDDTDKLSQLINAESKGFVISLEPHLEPEKQKAKLTAMQVCINANQPHSELDNIRQKLAIAHGLKSNEWQKIVITSVFEGSLCYEYTVADLEPNAWETVKSSIPGSIERLKEQFNDFKSAKIHPLLYRPAFDINNFDKAGDKEFKGEPRTFQLGPSKELERPYTQPSEGWRRYGLKVLGTYDDDLWMEPFWETLSSVSKNVWWRAFHGTLQSHKHGVDSVDALKQIQQDGFIESEPQTRGENQTPLPAGVYCATSPEAAYIAEESLVLKLKDQTPDGETADEKTVEKKFEFVIQCAVRPSHDGLIELSDHWWLVKDRKDVRPYGILFREVETDTPGQDQTSNESG